MERMENEMFVKHYDRKEITGSMMRIDNLRSENNENYLTLYKDTESTNCNPEFEKEDDVKIWIPISSRI